MNTHLVVKLETVLETGCVLNFWNWHWWHVPFDSPRCSCIRCCTSIWKQ